MTKRKPPRTRCPCCGAIVAALHVDKMPRMGANQQALINIVRAAKGGRVPTLELADRIWASDANGGPKLPLKTIAVMVRQINVKTLPFKFRIACGGGNRDGYRLLYL